jgi:hypothetical protein
VFHNTGVRPLQEDLGRQNVTQLPADAASFRVASLRNVELTAPYFHNGSAETLADAVQLYNRGGDFHANQAPNTGPRNYTQAEVDALVAVLRTLTDPRVAAGVQPFDRPLLGSQNGAFATSLGRGDTTSSGTLVATAPWAPRLGEAWFRLGLTGATHGAPTFLMWDTAVNPGAPALWNVQLALTPNFQVLTTGPAQRVGRSIRLRADAAPVAEHAVALRPDFLRAVARARSLGQLAGRDVERAAHPAALKREQPQQSRACRIAARRDDDVSPHVQRTASPRCRRGPRGRGPGRALLARRARQVAGRRGVRGARRGGFGLGRRDQPTPCARRPGRLAADRSAGRRLRHFVEVPGLPSARVRDVARLVPPHDDAARRAGIGARRLQRRPVDPRGQAIPPAARRRRVLGRDGQPDPIHRPGPARKYANASS